jgi:hypothetical protein
LSTSSLVYARKNNEILAIWDMFLDFVVLNHI